VVPLEACTRTTRARHGEHAEWIVVPQIALDREGKARQIIERAQIARMHAGRVKTAPIVSNVFVCVPERPLQALQLQGVQLIRAGGLDGLQISRQRLSDRHLPSCYE
jgi:hypothetical protein